MSTYDDWKTTPPDDDPWGEAWYDDLWPSGCQGDPDPGDVNDFNPDHFHAIEDGRWPNDKGTQEWQDTVCQDLMECVEEFLQFGTLRELLKMILED